MSGRKRQTLSPTLFPFLAVLVCTLGTLILLLALVARNTSQAAQAIAELPQEDLSVGPDQLTVRDVEQLVEEEEFRLGELVSFREAQTSDLERRRDQLAHLDDHMRRIRERLKEISDAMELAMSEEPMPETSREELEKLKSELVKEEEVVRKLREDLANEKPRFVIVPHQGPNGTTRRPLYLECTRKGVTIWPEGVVVSMRQLENSSSGANPLDDALRAARYHALNEYGDTIPPYPMLLVRPDGVESYFAARAAMLEWDDQFGYELVPADVNLAYPNPDPAMRKKLQYAIDQATERLNRYAIARTMTGRGSTRPGPPGGPRGYSGDGRYGGGRSSAGSNRMPTGSGSSRYTGSGARPAKKLPRLSVAEMDRQGRRSGFRDHRTLPRSSYGSPGQSGTSITAEDAKRRLEQQIAQSDGNFSEGMPDLTTGQGEGRSRDDGGTAINQIGAGDSKFADLPNGEYSSMGGGTVADERGRIGNESGDGGRGGFELPRTGEAGSFDASSVEGSIAEAAPGNAAQPNGSEKPSEFKQPDGAQSYAASTSQTGDQPMTLSEMGNADFEGRAGRRPNNSSEHNPNGFGPMSGASQMTNPQQAQDASQQNAPRATKLTMPENASPSRRPRQNAPTRNQAGQPSQSMVKRSGSNWAVPSSIALGQGNEIVRSIRVQVHQDRFVIMPSASNRNSESFAIGSDGVNLATLQLATALKARIQRWGAAAPGARWSPRLMVDVMPGAEQRFGQLQRLMTGSGLPVERSQLRQADSTVKEDLR